MTSTSYAKKNRDRENKFGRLFAVSVQKKSTTNKAGTHVPA